MTTYQLRPMAAQWLRDRRSSARGPIRPLPEACN
jgi:hypothetical protein